MGNIAGNRQPAINVVALAMPPQVGPAGFDGLPAFPKQVVQTSFGFV